MEGNVNFCEKELNKIIGIDDAEDKEKYKQLLYKYYLKSDDLESKCLMLQRNFVEMQDALEKAKNVRDSALKDKENMTLKFAKGERQMLNEKELKDKAEIKCKALLKEIEVLNQKLHIQADEKNRISTLYDNKLHELRSVKVENEGIRNQNCISKNELKLCQIALKNQSEQFKKAQNTIENLKNRIETFETEERKINDLKFKMENIELDRNEKELLLEELNGSFSELREKYDNLIKENGTFSDKIKKLELELFEYRNLSQHKVFDFDTSKKNEDEGALENIKQKLDLLKMKNEEVENNIKSSRIRETDSLLFSQRLAEKNATLQSENQDLKINLNILSEESEKLNDVVKDLKNKLLNTSKRVENENQSCRQEKSNSLIELEGHRKKSNELKEQNFKLKQQLLDREQEISVIRRKYSNILRQLRKELSSVREDSLSNCSFSSLSLVNDVSLENDRSEDMKRKDAVNMMVLFSRLLHLQGINVKKSEKIDFLEDRINLLLFELQNKRKLLQFYFLNEQTDALTSNEMDRAKRVIGKFGGVMASLYDGRISDRNLTLELSLEINRKLQAVLEDTLLKNIILKDNVETLGEEIDRLKNLLVGKL